MATNRVKLEDVVEEAKTALEAGNADRAITLCNHVFRYFPRCLEASRVLAEAYTEKRLLDEADQLLAFVLSADPQDVLGYADRGFIAFERGNLDDTIMYYERAIELDSSIEKLRDELLNLYREKAAGSRARIRITKAGLANGRLQQGFYAQAIEEYSSILREVPNRLDIQVGLLEAYWRNKDYPRAEKLALELLENHPNLVKANLILWHIYGFRRHQDNAAQYIEKAHALDPLSLIAERMFDDPVTSNDVMSYISMLGTPNVPPPPLNTSAPSSQLVPDWAGNSGATDRVLGLRPESAAPEPEAESNLGIDIFALLAATEAAVAERKQEEQVETEKHERQEAQAELDQFRSSVGGTSDVDSVFDFFEEVKPESLPTEKTSAAGSGAFDLDFSSAASDDFDLFGELEPAKTGDSSPAASNSATKSATPDLFDDIFGDGEPESNNRLSDSSLPVFDLDAISSSEGKDAENPPVFDLFADEPESGANPASLAPAAFDLFSDETKANQEEPPVFDLFEDSPTAAASEAAEPVPFDLFADEPQKPDFGQEAPPIFDLFEDSSSTAATSANNSDLPAFDLEQFTTSDESSQAAEQPFFLEDTATSSQPAQEFSIPDFAQFDTPPATGTQPTEKPADSAEPLEIPGLFDFDEPPPQSQAPAEFNAAELPDFLAQALNDEPGEKPSVDMSRNSEADLPDFLNNQFQDEPLAPATVSEPGAFSVTDFLSSVDAVSVSEPELSGIEATESALPPYLVGAPLPRMESEAAEPPVGSLLPPYLVGAPLPRMETEFAELSELPDLPDFSATSSAQETGFVLPEIPDFPTDVNNTASSDFELPPLPDFELNSSYGAGSSFPEIPDFSAFDVNTSVSVADSGLADLPPLPDIEGSDSGDFNSELASLPPLPDLTVPDSASFDLSSLPDLPEPGTNETDFAGLAALPDLPELEANTANNFELPDLPELVAEDGSVPNLDDFELPPLPDLEAELPSSSMSGERGLYGDTEAQVSEAELPPLPDFLVTEPARSDEFSLELPPLPDLPTVEDGPAFEEFNLDIPPLPELAEPAASPDLPEFAEPAFELPPLSAQPTDFAEPVQAAEEESADFLNQAATEAADLVPQPALEAEEDNNYLNFLVEQNASQTLPGGKVADTEEVLDFQRWTPSGKPARHAFHKRDERGPVPDFVLADNQATGQVQPNQPDVQDLSADSLISSSRLPGDETMQPGTLPQQYQEQENDAMPIKRGPQDDNDVFDWEREELPDYLQAFAMDEDEVARSGLAAPNPAVSDVNTGPARMRPRDDTSPSGDLPDWLNPTGGMGGRSVRGEQVDLTGSPRPGSGSLPNWLDQTDLDAPTPKSGSIPLLGDDDLGMNDLQPFGLADDGFGGPPPVRPTANAGRPGSGVPATPPTPNIPSFGGMDDMNDLQPFNFDDPAGSFGTPAPAPARPAAPPPSTPTLRPTPPAPPASNIPSFGGMDDMDDLQPFNFDDPAGSFGTPAPAPSPMRPAAPTPPAPAPQPSAAPSFSLDDDFGGMGEFGDLQPFSFDEPGGGLGAAPARPAPTPPAPQPQPRPNPPAQPNPPALGSFGAPTPAMPFGAPGGNLFDDDMSGGDALQPFNIGLDDSPFNPGARPTPPPARPNPPAQPNPPALGSFGAPTSAMPFGAPGAFDPGGDMAGMDDLQPFNFGEDVFGTSNPTGSRGAPSGLGFGAMDPMETLSPRPFHGNRGRHPEQRVEAEPGQDGPLRSFGWLTRIQEQRQQETSGSKPDESTFTKLQRRKHELEVQGGGTEGRIFKPQTSPLPGELDFNALNVTEGGNIQPVQARPGTQNLQTPPSPRDLHAQTGPYSRPNPATKPPTSAKPAPQDMPIDVFDLGDLGLTTDLSDEAFNQSLDQTLPTPKPDGVGLEAVAPYRTPVQPLEGVDIDPFDFTNIPPDGPLGEDVAFPIETPSLRQPETTRPPVVSEAFTPDFDLDFTEPTEEDLNFGQNIFQSGNPQPDKFDLPSFHLDQDVPLGNGSTKPTAPDYNFNLPGDEFPQPDFGTTTPVAKPDFDFGLDVAEPVAKPDFDFSLDVTKPVQEPEFDFGTTKPIVKPDFDFGTTKPAQEPDFDFGRPQPEARKPEPEPQQPVAVPNRSIVSQPAINATNGGAKVHTGSLLNRGGTTGNLTATLQLANRFFEQQDDNQAIIYFANAVKQADNETLDKIVLRLREIAAMPGKNPRYHRALGDAYKKQGHFQLALAEYSKALAPLKK